MIGTADSTPAPVAADAGATADQPLSVEVSFDATQRARPAGDRPRGGGTGGNDCVIVVEARAGDHPPAVRLFG